MAVNVLTVARSTLWQPVTHIATLWSVTWRRVFDRLALTTTLCNPSDGQGSVTSHPSGGPFGQPNPCTHLRYWFIVWLTKHKIVSFSIRRKHINPMGIGLRTVVKKLSHICGIRTFLVRRAMVLRRNSHFISLFGMNVHLFKYYIF